MNIPLDNLYHYINGLFTEPVCMYLFYPHGSRNILDIVNLNKDPQYESIYLPIVLCHDQEPLNYQFYQNHSDSVIDYVYELEGQKCSKETLRNSNLKLTIYPRYNIYNKIMLIHSEKNSIDLDRYLRDDFVDVYYWGHAVIARDWYRFAEFDQRLNVQKIDKKLFLIYCRDWSGSREYRVKFQELLYQYDLVKHSVTGIMKTNGCNDCGIENFEFKNPSFVPTDYNFFYELADNNASSANSADYCPEDFINTQISVVLETVFDDSKIHLTEKILRPIACGHPFMLAAGPGSLQYLRDYGFKTFSPWINEDYDLETDSTKRLEKIVQSMKEFSNLPIQKKTKIYQQINKIAAYNKKWFFSLRFINLVQSELVNNMMSAMKEIKHSRAELFRSRSKQDCDLQPPTRSIIAKHLRKLKKINPPG